MDLWIIYNSTFDVLEETPATRMLNEALNQGIKAKLMFYPYFNIENNTLYYKNEIIEEYPKIVFVRGQEHILMNHFENKGVKTINSSYTITTCRDKWLTHSLVDTLNIKQIKTYLLGNYTFEEICNKVGLPFILKYRHGAQGNGVILVNNENDYNQNTQNIDRDEYIIQEYIRTSYGKDVRVYVVGNKAIGAVLRENNSDFKSNLAQGGLSYNYELTDELIENSINISKALKGDIISVDYVIGVNNLLFCEANTNAGFASFNYLGYPMREIFMKYIKSLI